MKSLLQINSVVNSGSTGRIAEEIGQMAITNGWKSYIAYGRNESQSKSELIKIGTDWDIKLHGLRTRFLDQHGLGSYNATIKLLEKIDQIKPDIIHLHNLHGYYLNIEVLVKYLAKKDIPVVWTFHDCWPMTGHCAHFDFVGCKKWETQCSECPQTKIYPVSFLIDRSRKNYTIKKHLFNSIKNLTIVPVSGWLRGIVGHSFLSKYPVKLINNGVDVVVFSPKNDTETVKKKYGIGNLFMLLGVASVWSDRKRLEDYVKLSKVLTTDCVIVLVGLSEVQIKTLPKSIIGIPRTEDTMELAKLYSAADLTLNLSVEETFGLTTVEGFACGTPGIVYNCTASPELITPETGFIIQKEDIQELMDAIIVIKLKGKSSYSSACRERAEKLYNKNDRYQEYINLYDSLLR